MMTTVYDPDPLAKFGVPGDCPEVFAPGVVSVQGRYEYGLCVSPDGTEIYFTAQQPNGRAVLMVMRFDGRSWSEPTAADLTSKLKVNEMELFFSPDGTEAYFAAFDTREDVRIWRAVRHGEGWKDVMTLESPVNDAPAFYATVTAGGTMYYTNVAERAIYEATMSRGRYEATRPVGLPFGVHPFIVAEGSLLLFNGRGSLYASMLSEPGGSWSDPTELAGELSSPARQSCPSLSPDGQFLFFSQYDEPRQISNIYWVRNPLR